MQDTSLKTNQFYAELKNLCNTNSLIDCAYLLQSSTGRTFLAYSTQKYNHTEMQPVKEDLLNGQFEPCNGFSYPIVTLAGEQFLAVSLCFQDSFFGALIKVDSLLSSLKNREKEGDLYRPQPLQPAAAVKRDEQQHPVSGQQRLQPGGV